MTDMLDDIRSDLVDGAARRIRRRRNRQRFTVGAIAVVAAVAVVVAGVGRDRTDAPSAFAVSEVGDGTLRVEIYPEFDEADALRAELNAHGIDVEVITIRAHPSLDGVIELVSHEQQSIGAIQPVRGEMIVNPAAVTGPIEMLIYSTPPADLELRDGEVLWQAAPSVFHPEEPLGGLNCALDGPLTTEALEEYAATAGIDTFEWWSLENPEPSNVRPDGYVAGATLRSPVLLSVVVSDDPIDASMLAMDEGLHFTEQAECTEELAERWSG